METVIKNNLLPETTIGAQTQLTFHTKVNFNSPAMRQDVERSLEEVKAFKDNAKVDPQSMNDHIAV